MTRHSKNRCDLHFFTYAERAEAGYTTSVKDVLGTDAMLPFGFCQLSLKPCKEPMATPYGHIFDRDHIIQYLAHQKEELLKDRAEFELEQKKKEKKKVIADEKDKQDQLEKFDLQERGMNVLKSGKITSSRVEFENADKAKLRSHNFWNACDAPSEKKKDKEKKSLATRCPLTGKKLKFKDLIAINFEVHNEKMLADGGGRGMYQCAVTKKAITHQKVALLKPSGQVVLEDCLAKCVYPSMQCPITSKPLEKSDIIKLVEGFTGFSAHNKVQVEKMQDVKSLTHDAVHRNGSLGAKGTCLWRG